jgi:hypothetical protein
VRPRYTVGTVTGWPITPTTLHDTRAYRSKPTTIAYVYDSAYCYRIVAEFTRRNVAADNATRTALEAAQALADRLNEEERAWLASLTPAQRGEA